jgi:hypothetical protein
LRILTALVSATVETGVDNSSARSRLLVDPPANRSTAWHWYPLEATGGLIQQSFDSSTKTPHYRSVAEPESAASLSSDRRLREFQQLLDKVVQAFETGPGGTLRRVASALHVLHGSWRIVFVGLLAWVAHNGPISLDRRSSEEVDHVIEQALRQEQAAVVGEPALGDGAPVESALVTEARPQYEEPLGVSPAVDGGAERRQRERDEALLETVRSRRERIERELEAESRRLRFFEVCVYSMLVIAAGIALTIATIGAVIILSSPTAGAIVTGVALVPGSGAAILFRLARTVAARRTETAAARERNGDALESVQARLSLADQRERDRMIGEYAAALRSR